MNFKLVAIGGLAYWITVFILSYATGQLIHMGVLEAAYDATNTFWRPELRLDPPDMAAVMPEWIVTGVVFSLVIAAIYGFVRPAFSGAAWKKGLSYGLLLGAFTAAYNLSLSGVFDLPGQIWGWWTIESLILFAIGGTVLGVVADKVAPN